MTIKEIQDRIVTGEYVFSEHSVKRMIQRSISRIEIEQAVIAGEIIEEYYDDKYTPSCLIYGRNDARRNLHIHVSFPPTVVIITVYDPDPKEWIDYKVRR